MNFLDWITFLLALVGAGAWIPTIFDWFRRPQVHVVSGERLEVSYLDVGGVINVACSIASFRKACLVESLSLHVQHEDGTRIEFFCVGLSESTTAESSSGEKVQWGKQSQAHTLAIAADSAVERLAFFRERAQSARLQGFFERSIPLWERLKQTEGQEWREAMRRTDVFDEWKRAAREGQPWRPGHYSATMVLKITQLPEPLAHRFSFDLSDTDFRLITRNLAPIDNYVTGILLGAEDTRRPTFTFAYPARTVNEESNKGYGGRVA